MKRIISLILICVLLMAAIPASAEEKAPRLFYEYETRVVCENMRVYLWALNLPKSIGVSVQTQYDPAILEPIGFESRIDLQMAANDVLKDGVYSIVWLPMDRNKESSLQGDLLLGIYTFKILAMPEAKTTVLKSAASEYNTLITAEMEEVRFSEEICNMPVYNPHPFSDVENNWFKEAVLFVYNHDLMNGKPGGIFDPNGNTTRAELVTVLYRLEGQPHVPAAAPFTDLVQSWYRPAVAWAYEKGIVTGRTDSIFDPSAPITRQEIATILYRYAQMNGMDVSTLGDLSVYPDVAKVSSYAKVPLQWASAQGLINGIPSGKVNILSPKTNATRAQIATILMRFIQKNSEA